MYSLQSNAACEVLALLFDLVVLFLLFYLYCYILDVLFLLFRALLFCPPVGHVIQAKLKQPFTACCHITIRRFKVSGVPWVCHICRRGELMILFIACKRKQFVNLFVRITVRNTRHIADIRRVHPDEIVIFVIIRTRHLHCTMRNHRDIHLAQLIHGTVMRPVPDFLTAGCRGINVKV